MVPCSQQKYPPLIYRSQVLLAQWGWPLRASVQYSFDGQQATFLAGGQKEPLGQQTRYGATVSPQSISEARQEPFLRRAHPKLVADMEGDVTKKMRRSSKHRILVASWRWVVRQNWGGVLAVERDLVAQASWLGFHLGDL